MLQAIMHGAGVAAHREGLQPAGAVRKVAEAVMLGYRAVRATGPLMVARGDDGQK